MKDKLIISIGIFFLLIACKKESKHSHYNGFGQLASEWKDGFVFGIFGKSENRA